MPLSPFQKPKPPQPKNTTRALSDTEIALVRRYLGSLVHETTHSSDRPWWESLLRGRSIDARTRAIIFDRIRKLAAAGA